MTLRQGIYLSFIFFGLFQVSCKKQEDQEKADSVAFLVDTLKLNLTKIDMSVNLLTLGKNASVSVGFMYHNKEQYFSVSDLGVDQVSSVFSAPGKYKITLDNVPWRTNYYIYPFVKVEDAYFRKELQFIKSSNAPIIDLVQPVKYEVVKSDKPRFEWKNLQDKSLTYQVYLKSNTDKAYKKIADVKNFNIFSPKVSTIKGNQVYFWKVVAINEQGDRVTESFERPFNSPKNIEVISPIGGDLKISVLPIISWKITEGAPRTSLSYKVQLREFGALEFETYASVSNVEVIAQVGKDTDILSKQLNKILTPGISYQYRIILYIDDKYAGQSSQITFRTVNDIVLKEPQAKSKSVSTHTTFSWAPPSITTVGYNYEIHIGQRPFELKKVGTVSRGVLRWTVKNDLQSGARYYWKVLAVSVSSETTDILAESETQDFYTLPHIVLNKVEVLAGLYTSGIRLSWKPYISQAISGFYYTVYLGTDPSKLTEVNVKIEVAHSYTDNTLSPGLRYYYKVALKNTFGTVAESPIDNFKIPSAKVYVITGLGNQNISKIRRNAQGGYYISVSFQDSIWGEDWKDLNVLSAYKEAERLGKKINEKDLKHKSVLFEMRQDLTKPVKKWLLRGSGNSTFGSMEWGSDRLLFSGIYDRRVAFYGLGIGGVSFEYSPLAGYDMLVGSLYAGVPQWVTSINGTKDTPSGIHHRLRPDASGSTPDPGELDALFSEWHDDILDLTEGGENQVSSVYASGTFFQELKFGSSIRKGIGALTAFVSKFDEEGKPVWLRSFDQKYLSDRAEAKAIVYQKNVGVLTAVNYNGSLYFTMNSKRVEVGSAVTQPVLVYINPVDGSVTDYHSLVKEGSMKLIDMVSDSEGKLYLSFHFTGVAKFFDDRYVSSYGGQDILLMKFDPLSKSVLWLSSIGGVRLDKATDLVCDEATNSILISGSYQGTFVAGAYASLSAGDVDGFVCRVDASSGGVRNLKTIGGLGHDEASSIQPYNQNQVLIGGSFELVGHLLSGSIRSVGQQDAFLEIVEL